MLLDQAKVADIVFADNQWYVTGDLDHANAMSVFDKSIRAMKTKEMFTINFSKLKSCNSLGLVMIFEWLKYAKKHQIILSFRSIPADILGVAKAARLEHLVPKG